MSCETLSCPQCGKSPLPGARFCHLCGAALAAEERQAQSRSVPVPERATLNEPCAVIYAGNDQMDVRRVGRYVAEAVRAPLPDVTRTLRTSKGVLATGLEPARAVALAERLEDEFHTPVLVIPDEACAPLQPAMRIRHVTFSTEGFDCEAYTWDRTESVRATWDQTFLVSCGRLEVQEVVAEREEDEEKRKKDFISRRIPKLTTLTHYEFLLDIILFGPACKSVSDPPDAAVAAGSWRRLRLDQNTAGFSLTEMEHDPALQLRPLYRSAVSLEQFARGVPMNRGVALLSSGADELAWEPLTFLNKNDFDSYTYWLLQLVRYGRPIPL